MYGCRMLLHLCPRGNRVEGNYVAVNSAVTQRTEVRWLQSPWAAPPCSGGLQEWEGGQGEHPVSQLKGFFSFFLA